ncbi:MAG TPA: GNAT family N-acyltransferase [Verrucomicrobiota bacterium]|nr:GNAT family N-acyltransferase [Verrucomicrobiota bacterium]
MSVPDRPTSNSERDELGSRMLARATSELPYQLRLATSKEDLRAAQTLRFMVFNLELNEGLESSYATLRDEDPFDAICDHLLVETKATGEVIGTYRLQSGVMAAKNRGFYSEQEFDFEPFRPVQHQIIELGRACVHSDHRSLPVIGLLWQGIHSYARLHHARYLVGCSSLTSQDAGVGAAAYSDLARDYLVEAAYRTLPLPAYRCPMDSPEATPPKIPKLLRAYLSFGAKICGPPAIDREFKTIDFLTWMDLEALPPAAKRILGQA